MVFMFESRFAVRRTRHAVESSELQSDYFEGWQGLDEHFKACARTSQPRM
jgi:homogentisate 1,2-dioxygenase